MTYLKTISFCFILILISSACQTSTPKADHKITFGDLVNLETLTDVEISNNSGTFSLTREQIKQLKEDLNNMPYDPNISVKVGAIHIRLKINEKNYNIATATHGNYIEIHRDMVNQNLDLINNIQWLYFKTNGVNFDNYKAQNQ